MTLPANPAPATHNEQLGLAALRSDQAQRLAASRTVRADIAHYTDAEILFACDTFLDEVNGANHADVVWAKQMKATLEKYPGAAASVQT